MGSPNMHHLTEKTIRCPYCGEKISVLIDPADADQQYIEDCQVCCRPINFSISQTAMGELLVDVYGDNDAY